jgi:hypothetical protein
MAARIGVIGRVTEVRPVGGIADPALERIYQDRQLSYIMDCPAGTRFQGERQDLEEMLGNLLDNASKWGALEGDALGRAVAATRPTAPLPPWRSASKTMDRGSPRRSWATPSFAAAAWTKPSWLGPSAIRSSRIWPLLQRQARALPGRDRRAQRAPDLAARQLRKAASWIARHAPGATSVEAVFLP